MYSFLFDKIGDAKLFRCLDNAFAIVMVLDLRLGPQVSILPPWNIAILPQTNQSKNFRWLCLWVPVLDDPLLTHEANRWYRSSKSLSQFHH
jgi:hypothetical protein